MVFPPTKNKYEKGGSRPNATRSKNTNPSLKKGKNDFVLLPERLAFYALHLRHPIQWDSPKFCQLTVFILTDTTERYSFGCVKQFPASVIQKYSVVRIVATFVRVRKQFCKKKKILSNSTTWVPETGPVCAISTKPIGVHLVRVLGEGTLPSDAKPL